MIISKKQFKKCFFIMIFFLISSVFSFYLSRRYCLKRETKIMNSYKKVSVVIQQGDTAWDIQSKLAPNSNTGELLCYVSKINKRKMGEIVPGETLLFLLSKNKKRN